MGKWSNTGEMGLYGILRASGVDSWPSTRAGSCQPLDLFSRRSDRGVGWIDTPWRASNVSQMVQSRFSEERGG